MIFVPVSHALSDNLKNLKISKLTDNTFKKCQIQKEKKKTSKLK
jgi:hypothetical protein